MTFQPPLCPIPVGGPFHRVTVDVLQLLHVVVFMDYLAKWPKAFVIPNQKAETIIAEICIEQIVRM